MAKGFNAGDVGGFIGLGFIAGACTLLAGWVGNKAAEKFNARANEIVEMQQREAANQTDTTSQSKQ